jgi:putative PIN family toxin of toxin-antitoxin system
VIRIVLDTNVLISALFFGGNPQTVLEKAIMGQIGLVLSSEILNEFEEVLCGKKYAYPPEFARNIVRELEAISELVFPTRKIAAVKADPHDNLILECAVKAGADYLVSGDNHLLELKRFEGIPILSPAQFLEAVKR